MVSTKSYRLLSRFTYDLIPQLLRSNRLGGPPNETEVIFIYMLYIINVGFWRGLFLILDVVHY